MSFIQDVRYGLRLLRTNPGFTIVAVVLLALGIGANTAIFSVVNAVLLRPLPYANPDRLITIRETNIPKFPEFSIAPGNFLDWQKQNTTFEKMAAYRGQQYILTGSAEPERVRGMRITADLLSLLGASPILGREIRPDEDQENKGFVVLLSHGFWQRRFGGDPGIVGTSLTLSAQPFTVIGVMPSNFDFPDPTVEVWTPMAFTGRDTQNHGGHYISVMGSLKQGVTLDQARADLSAIAKRLEEQYPDSNAGWGVKLALMQDYLVSDIKPSLLLLLAAVVLVLLIACANVANLLLVRAAARQRELSLRAALGASRWRVVRQMLTESVLLAIVGGGFGLAIAYWGLKLLLRMAPEGIPRVQNVSIDLGALVFTIGVTLFTGLLFGLLPAFHAWRPDLTEALKDGGRGGSEGRGRQRLRGALVVAEIAISLMLLVGAGLLIKSFIRLQGVSAGFDSANVLTTGIGLPGSKYSDDARRTQFFSQLLESLATLPGVQAAAVTQSLPITSDFVLGFVVQGRPLYKPGEGPSTNYYSVSPDYFKAMGIRLIRGRLFDHRDVAGSPRIAIINETMAKKYFVDEDPIGKRIHVTNGPETFREIVGIVADVRQYGLDQPVPAQTYEPFFQAPFNGVTLVARTDGEPLKLSAAVRSKVLAIDKDQPVSTFRTMEQIVANSIASRRFSMLLFGIFAALAMILAAVGIYGVMSYSVSQRRQEIGIRVALGASSRDVVNLIVRHGMLLAGLGVVIGLIAAFAASRVISTLLFGVSATDPLVFIAIPLLLAVVAFLACLLPARRATKVDPITALRCD
jgi:putative ABC transport system permease protein